VIKGSVTVTSKTREKEVVELLKATDQMKVYVGIPEDTTERREGEMTNAALCYIHTNGSELRNIPARPIIEPAINAPGNFEPIQEELRQAIEYMAFRGEPTTAFRHLKRAGMIAQNVSRKWFTDPRNGWAANQPSTILAKTNKLKGKAKLEALENIAKGNINAVDTPLIDTGQLRKAIIYVVKMQGNLQKFDDGDNA